MNFKGKSFQSVIGKSEESLTDTTGLTGIKLSYIHFNQAVSIDKTYYLYSNPNPLTDSNTNLSNTKVDGASFRPLSLKV